MKTCTVCKSIHCYFFYLSFDFSDVSRYFSFLFHFVTSPIPPHFYWWFSLGWEFMGSHKVFDSISCIPSVVPKLSDGPRIRVSNARKIWFPMKSRLNEMREQNTTGTCNQTLYLFGAWFRVDACVRLCFKLARIFHHHH